MRLPFHGSVSTKIIKIVELFLFLFLERKVLGVIN